MRIIKDVKGVRYRLGMRGLRTLPNDDAPEFYIFFKEIKPRNFYTQDHAYTAMNDLRPHVQLRMGTTGPNCYVAVPIDKETKSIGCRQFPPRTFSAIMKAAGLK